MTKEERKEYMHQYYLKNKKKLVELVKQYQQKHKEELLEYNKQYRIQWVKENSEYHKIYYQKHKEELLRHQKQYYQTLIGRANMILNTYRKEDKKAKNRGECTLTPEWIVDNIFSGQKCVYCGEDDWTKLGCDRIDNDKPHTPDNVVCCCGECNVKRNRKTYEEFMKIINE